MRTIQDVLNFVCFHHFTTFFSVFLLFACSRQDEKFRSGKWLINVRIHFRFYFPSHITVLRKAFESFDREKTGSISTETVAEILRLMGQPFNRQILEEMIEEVDEDKSGRLEFEEFIILAAKFIVEEDEEARKWHEWLISTECTLKIVLFYSPKRIKGSFQIVRQRRQWLYSNINPEGNLTRIGRPAFRCRFGWNHFRNWSG